MEDLLHISAELQWSEDYPTKNDVVYCTSSTGLNSPVLYYHFLQFALKSNCNVITLISNSTYDDLISICKRNGVNIESFIDSKKLVVLSVSLIEDMFLTTENGIQMKSLYTESDICTNEKTEESKTNYIKSTFSSCVSDLTKAIQTTMDSTSPTYVLIDDVFSLGSSNQAIVESIREIRSLIEETFTNFSLVLCHPCGLDQDVELYHQLVHMSNTQFLLMPLSTGHSQNVHGSLVVHTDCIGETFQSVTVRRHIKISDSSARLLIPGSI